METYLNVFEASRVDASIGAFIGLTSTIIHAFYTLGSEEQKNEYLSKIANVSLLVSWAYSEPETGSYSSSLQCKAEKNEDFFFLNGTKRWVGNYNFPFALVWARNIKTSKIEAFLVQINLPGVKLEVMKGKFNSRVVQNGNLVLDNVKVPFSARLAFSDDEAKVAQVFINARAGMVMAPTGLICGVFQNSIKYLNDKVRFGARLTSYQMIQEKLVKMLAIFNNSFLLSWRLVQLQQSGHVNIANTALVKSIVISIGRDAVRIAREMMGSNGISLDNFVMKALVDMESYYNLESTHNMAVLIAGREITGIPALKSYSGV
jgi:alkylation response protein AidB-like acyl-CoA dehydrogenase